MKTLHLSSLLSCIAIALAFTACGDNAIEAETEMQSESFAAKGTAIDKLDKQLDRIDYYTCTEKYNSIRCNSFYAKYGSFEAKEIADTLNYDDHAVYIGPDKEDLYEYITENWQLVMTLANYIQILDSIPPENPDSTVSETSESAEPKDNDSAENRAEERAKGNDDSYMEFIFTVTAYSDGEESFVREFTVLQDTSGEAQWKGEETVRTIIPRGTDEIQICLETSKIDDVGDEVFSASDCISLETIGKLDSTTYEEMLSEWTGVNAVWGWALSPIN
jgi:hypothetical protein